MIFTLKVYYQQRSEANFNEDPTKTFGPISGRSQFGNVDLIERWDEVATLRTEIQEIGVSLRFLLKIMGQIGLSELSPQQFPQNVADRFRKGQLQGTVDQMRVMLLGNTFFAPVLAMQAWNLGANSLVVAWTAVALIYSWWLFFSWRKIESTKGSAADMQRFVVETFFNSLMWSVGMAIFYPLVDGDEKAIVTTVIAGSLALGTMGFSRAPQAGFVYLGVQVVGNSLVAFLNGLKTGSNADYLIALLMSAAGISLFSATIERGKSAIAAFKATESLSEKSEVVELLLKDYEQQVTEWLWQTDGQGTITRAPIQILELLGVSDEEMGTSRPIAAMAARCLEESKPDIERLKLATKAHSEFHDIQLAFKDQKTGQTRWILAKGMPQFVGDVFNGYRGIFADATVAVEASRKLEYMANFDSLTNLLNRNSVQNRLSKLQADSEFAAAFAIDLDSFKQVNDSYGHAFGDLLLKEVGTRIAKILPENAWASRIGGDEFFVVLKDHQPVDEAIVTQIARQICDQLSRMIIIGDLQIQVSASVGIARFPHDTQQGLELLTLADMSLYSAKGAGGGRVVHFDAELQNILTKRVTTIERLKLAVRNNAIEPFYQSQHSLCGGQLIGFEALARWTDDELGFVGPDVFIPLAEQTGLITELGEQILRKACEDAKRWANILGEAAPLISVNISPVQFARVDVADLVARVLTETGLPARLLEIEVTEGVLIASKEKTAETLREISAQGVSIALDDFGTGYSSLSYLKDLPLDRLKIDRSFVSELQRTGASPIVSAVIQLGHNLGLSVIAEGVETEAQIEFLRHLGCDDGQGYLFSRAMKGDAADALVANAARLATPAKSA